MSSQRDDQPDLRPEGLRGQAPVGAQTLDRGLRVLWHLARQPSGATLVELSRSLEMNRTALHRVLETFVAHDLVRRDP